MKLQKYDEVAMGLLIDLKLTLVHGEGILNLNIDLSYFRCVVIVEWNRSIIPSLLRRTLCQHISTNGTPQHCRQRKSQNWWYPHSVEMNSSSISLSPCDAISELGPILLAWTNFNPSRDK